MIDSTQAPALLLTALFVSLLGYLYLRFRQTRTLYWFSGFTCVLAAGLLFAAAEARGLPPEAYRWLAAAGKTASLTGSALFLGALSPLAFRAGRFRAPYVVPFAAPLIVYAILLYGFNGGVTPQGPAFLVFPALGAVSYVAALFWSAARLALPRWMSMAACLLLGCLAFWICFTSGAAAALAFVECANLLMTAFMLAVALRRFSLGVLFSVAGFTAWGLAAARILPVLNGASRVDHRLVLIIGFSVVVAAIGITLLLLEEQLALGRAAEERDRRALGELEAYARLVLSRRRLEDFDRQATVICETVAEHSRFPQVALLLLDSAGRYKLAGTAGLDAATVRALEDLTARIKPTGFLVAGSVSPAVAGSQTVELGLGPWLWPGDNIKLLGLTTVLAVPLVNRSVTEGALLLAGNAPGPLRTEDLLPVEMLAVRVQASRSQTMMFEKLIDSDKYGHLGQLAANVTQQLNNPLTVILGYASLLSGTAQLADSDRKAVETILTEARQMRTTLDSLLRITRPQSDQLTAVAVNELLTDLAELHRADFLERSIEFRLSLAPGQPRALCSAQQLRQAVRHCLQFCMEAVEGGIPGESRTVRLEASEEAGMVRIVVAHSGPGFSSSERAFDPYVSPQTGRESTVLGLSLIATIMRDNQGRASAENLEPGGAAIILELKAA